MSRKVYAEIYLHFVWRTKDNLPFVDNNIEKPLYDYIKHRCCEPPGVFCHTVGGTRDHVHLCVSVPPTLMIADWIGDLKGASSHYINHNIKAKSLQWQTGYGVVSFGKNNLEFVKKYVLGQKEHHASGKTHKRLEIIEDPAGS